MPEGWYSKAKTRSRSLQNTKGFSFASNHYFLYTAADHGVYFTVTLLNFIQWLETEFLGYLEEWDSSVRG